MSFEELAWGVQGRLLSGERGKAKFTGVSIDSRTIKEGQLFIAIRGEKNDGHAYIEKAIDAGASGVIADSRFGGSQVISEHAPFVVVEDTHVAMIKLAQNYRKSHPVKIIGITGSNGKTTTKEFAYELLRAVEPTAYRSAGNLNNLYGAPLALLSMPQNCQAAAIEMGISTKGEMSKLTNIVNPNVALITNVGPSHLEFLSSVEEVAVAKLEMVTALPAEIPLVINADNELLYKEARRVTKNIVTFAIHNEADFKPDSVAATDKGSRVTIEHNIFQVNIFGGHAVSNLLAAYAACRTLGYDFSNMDCAKINLSPASMRGEIVEKSGIKIINDAYNANPESVQAGLEAFKVNPALGRRILILGDMLELGERAEKYHRELGNSLADFDFAFAIVVGEWSRAVLEGARQAGISAGKLRSFRNSEEAAFGIGELIKTGDVVYVKGSRGVELEKIIEKIGERGGRD